MHNTHPRRLTRLAGLLALILAPVLEARETLIMAADAWCPYNCQEGDERPGYLVEIGQLAFKTAERDAVYHMMPWTRALKDTKAGKISMAIGAVGGDDSGNILNRVSLGVDRTTLITHADNPFRYTGVESLKGLMIGVINDYSYDGQGPVDDYIAAQGPDSQVVVLHRENALDMLIKMLQSNRIDGLLENPMVASHSIKGTPLEGKVRLQPISKGDHIYFAFTPSPAGQALADEFDRRVLELDKAGEIKRIMDRYGLPYEPLRKP